MKALLVCLMVLHGPILDLCLGAAIALDAPPQLVTASQSSGAAFFGPQGRVGRYIRTTAASLRNGDTKAYSVAWGPVEHIDNGDIQWFLLEGTKENGTRFRIWSLTAGYPAETRTAAQSQTARFILQQGAGAPREFRNRLTGRAVLPSVGGWSFLFPRAASPAEEPSATKPFPRQTRYLGHVFQLEAVQESTIAIEPAGAQLIELLPDVLVGVPSNARQKDETRQYDGSDYGTVRLSREDFRRMAQAGINCLRVDSDQLAWIDDLNVYYWGVGGKDIIFPECLYDSRYFGPTLFLDEPAVGTRDHVIRPRLEKEPAYRTALTPQIGFDAFREYFSHALREGAATSLRKGLTTRPDIDLGDMNFLQENLFSWETMVSTAAYQLSQDPTVPAAMVFEPPGRVGARRTIPELNMTYGCQLAVDDPRNLIDVIYGFLRGAARLTGKDWGTSIYGAVDRTDAFWFVSHAYDLGATRFFFWDNAQLACVPFQECLALARTIQMRVENHPHRDLAELKRAAEVAILLPAGYNLGHVHLGKGSLWGVGELNLERLNTYGVSYRQVMSNFFIEIERCLRFGVTFDLLTDLPTIRPTGYREVVRIREDGKVEVEENGRRSLLDQARVPARPTGAPPGLTVDLSTPSGKAPLAVRARAAVVQTAAPVYYTMGTDSHGVYHNAMVAWELYGPGEEDYLFLTPAGMQPRVIKTSEGARVEVDFTLRHPGRYRLRAATVDTAGRTTVRWAPIVVTE